MWGDAGRPPETCGRSQPGCWGSFQTDHIVTRGSTGRAGPGERGGRHPPGWAWAGLLVGVGPE